MPPPKQIWFAAGEELGADDISGRGAFTRRYIGINYSPPGASDEPAFTVEHTPQDISGLVVPALKVFAGPFSIGDAILVEKVVQTGNFLAFEYRGDDYFTVAGDGDTWTAGTIEAEKANAGGVEVAADGTVALDLTLANVFTTTTSQNTSWSTSAPPADGLGGQRVSFVVDNAGGHTVAWAAGFTNVDAIGPGDTGISVRTLQFDGSTWHQIAATLDGDAINAGAGDIDGSGTANFIPKWLDSDTLTDSIIREIGGEIGIGAAPNEVLTVEGRLSLRETTAPSNTADYGKIYVKSADSNAYFMNESGTEYYLVPVPNFDIPIQFPDSVSGEKSVFHFDILAFPYGVELVQVSITIPSDGVYNMVVEKWRGDPPAAVNDLVVVATGASDSYKAVLAGAMADSSLDAGDYLFLHIPDTVVDWVHVKVIFTINTS